MKKYLRTILILLVVIGLALSTASNVNALNNHPAEPARSAIRPLNIVGVPVPTAPKGTIFVLTPTYKWSKVTSATQYQIVLYQGLVTKYTRLVASSACGTTTCSNTPITVLAAGAYTWKVQAMVSGVWKPLSTALAFTVVNVIPTPISPSGATADATPLFKWSKITGATQYQFMVFKNTAILYSKTLPASVCPTTTCAYTPTNIINLGSYTWKVRALYAGAWRSYSAVKPFSIVTPVPTLVSPAGTWGVATPTYKWNLVPGATSYQLKLFKGTTLIYNKTATAAACNTSTCSLATTQILPLGIYTWKAQAKIDGLWKSFSPVKSFTIINIVPTPVTPSGITLPTSPSYVWTKIAGVSQYQLQVLKGATVVGTYTVAPTACGTTNCTYKPTQVLPYAAYSWKVRSMLNGAWGAFSTAKTFTVYNVIPTPTSPSGVISRTDPTFVWAPIAGATSYQIELYNGATLVYAKTALAGACDTVNCVLTPDVVLPYASYTWRVQAYYGGAWRTFSAYKAFILSNVPVPSAPSGMPGMPTATKPTFTWTDVYLATQYQFVVTNSGTSVEIYNLVVDTSGCSSGTCTNIPNTALDDAVYEWKVRAYVSGTWSAYSTPMSFTIQTAEVIPTVSAPVDDIVRTLPVYTWAAITYATEYQLDLYQGSGVIYTESVPTSSCSAGTCSYTPTTTLSLGSYTWHVRALVGGTWREFSLLQAFTVAPLGTSFSSPFTANATDWTPIWGTWSLDPDGYYKTAGSLNTYATVKHTGYYTKLTYEVKMKRVNSPNNANFLYIRGKPGAFGSSQKEWFSGLRFQYINGAAGQGSYSIYKTIDGLTTDVASWVGSANIVQNGWNVLRVTAKENGDIAFYINDNLTPVWSGNYPNLEFGEVGIGMYTDGIDPAGTMLYVDYATLDPTLPAGPDVVLYPSVEEMPIKTPVGSPSTAP